MARYIDPHIHMVSRTTDDYKRMALAGCALVSEPAFWAGFDRSGVEGFRDYFRQLTDFEGKRSRSYGIAHYTWLCINAKEAENIELSREVIAMIPEFLESSTVLGIGEIGLNKNTKNESTVFLEHLELAAKTDELILIARQNPRYDARNSSHAWFTPPRRSPGEVCPTVILNQSSVPPCNSTNHAVTPAAVIADRHVVLHA